MGGCLLILLLKDGNRPHNYKLVSFLTAASKMLEIVAHKQVSQCLEYHKIFWGPSSGWGNQSAVSCNLFFSSDIYLNMEKEWMTGVIYLNLKRVFNMVDHKILTNRLTIYGLFKAVVKWFGSYLTGRVQHTTVNAIISGERIIMFGIPQGSILSPVQFLVYINDLNKY